MKTRTLLSLAFGLVTAGACELESKSVGKGETDSGDSSSSDSGSSAYTVDQFVQDYAELQCAYMTECGCTNPNSFYEDLEACVADQVAAGMNQIEFSGHEDLVFDEACARSWLDDEPWPVCGAASNEAIWDATLPSKPPRCTVLRGSNALGEGCQSGTNGYGFNWASVANDCLEGLQCSEGIPRCEPVPVIKPDPGPGEDCVDEDAPGGQIYTCPATYVCDYRGTRTCVPISNLGESCVPIEAGCVNEAQCDSETEICVARVGQGEPCEYGRDCLSRHCDRVLGVCGTQAPACN